MPPPANKAQAVALFLVRSCVPTRPIARLTVSLLRALARPVPSPECQLRRRENQPARTQSTWRIAVHRPQAPGPVPGAANLRTQSMHLRKRWYADGKGSEPSPPLQARSATLAPDTRHESAPLPGSRDDALYDQCPSALGGGGQNR